MWNRQKQEAGSGSQLVQVAGDLIVGITEERATEIAELKAREVISEFTAESHRVAEERLSRFDQMLVGELTQRDLLQAFADPAYQVLLRKTQLHAASTAEPLSHELLTKLLSERAANNGTATRRVVNRAVEIVDDIDEGSLLALTVAWFVMRTVPVSVDAKPGLQLRNDQLGLLLGGSSLPDGSAWLDALDLVDCVRHQSGLSMIPFWDGLFQDLSGYVSRPLSTEDAEALLADMAKVELVFGAGVIGEHDFAPGKYRFRCAGLLALKTMLGPLESDVYTQAEEVLKSYGFGTVDPEVRERAIEFVNADLPHLANVAAWWDRIPGVLSVTPVGVAVAYSNMKRFDSLTGLSPLPDLLEGR